MSEGALLSAFQHALDGGELYMVYQPQVALADGALKRVEALVRWDHPDIGAVPPAAFVLLAEEHGLIGRLTEWGLAEVLRQWSHWHGQGLDLSVAFNISALSLEQLDFPDRVEEMCRQWDMPTDCLVVELTEGATQPLIQLMDTLTRFRIKGIGLALDDFGTGYSSLLQLRHLPFSTVKIDRAFVADLETSADCQLIVRAMIDLAHGLGLTATAEGVENEAQLRTLRDLGCDMAQGYLISPALPPDALAGWHQDFAEHWKGLVGKAEVAAV
ncbi:EAL domain-containing protein [Sphingomonas piscis]|uniref:EAL domain-containing protein n=1 Tax=Sphingomonas piscis TaxID=2714943 RepID=A0A6G7YS79_9SPHN|nr:EAL domain-containing protein [Sphingomonas piscis]QIK79597.1 EAL domain-containing protein [Sphingomonas piscis]